MTSVDELFKFSTNKGKVETIVILNPNEITDFPNHPFKIEDNEEMQQMVESIKSIGVKEPILVRPKQDGNYEMVAGHRRNYATKKAGLNVIPAIVREMTDEEATIIMVDSNIQREKILPSEKAFAYKMKLEAMKHQGRKETSRQVVEKIVSADLVGQNNGESGRQVQRYIRLTELIKELLDMVDIGKISFSPAIEISYLTKEEQYMLFDCITRYDATPSQSQAIFLKKLSQEKKLTTDKMEEIIGEEKPNQKEHVKILDEELQQYYPKSVVSIEEKRKYIIHCVKETSIREKRQREYAR